MSIDPSLLTTLVEDPSGTRLETHPEVGRTLVATRDFQQGEIVFREQPVMVWENGDWNDALSKLEQLPEDHRAGVLDMHHPDLDSVFCGRWKALARMVQMTKCPNVDFYLLFKFMVLTEINAHSYFGKLEEEFRETLVSSAEQSKSSLLLWGSKVSHSCSPNMSYTSRTQDGKIEYKAIRQIEEGDVLSFSYLGPEDLYTKPTKERQETLADEKCFICKCPRCEKFDYCRQYDCPTCPGTAVRTVVGDYWMAICPRCGPMDMEVPSFYENITQEAINALNTRAMLFGGMVDTEDVDVLLGMMETESPLAPAHYLFLRLLNLKIRLLASSAHFMQATHSRLLAAKAGVDLVSRTECVAACCDGKTCRQGSVVTRHPPVYACTTDAFCIYQDLVRYDPSGKSWPKSCVETIERYLPMMKINYGPEDVDVVKIESKLEKIHASSTGSVTPSGQKHSKRGGKRTNNKKRKGRKSKR